METTEIKPATTVAQEESNSPLTNFQQAALDAAEKDLENLGKELESKKYLVDIDKNGIATLSTFINEDAPWKFTESLGVIEVDKEMQIALKKGKLFTSSLAIEAIYYYLSKVEGKGRGTDTKAFSSVEQYTKMLKNITNALERVKADNEKYKQAQFVVAARREGIEPDASITNKES